ncbi:hypothetical protein FALBO_7394 [Fusarium albosuccineum]|uniref:Uncharacterized protein n=1 Tax=Fusarium albosuccineum TaxID=1237068 RepID=A0A8H4L9X3_9HYPO|nr:hypothetical protein FALBO_7394 [Fusarium albosuccineum]
MENKAHVPVSPIYVFSEVSHPRGTLPHTMVTKGSGRVAPAIMLWGIQAPMMCDHCAIQFFHYPSTSGEHGLFPFHACRVLPGMAGGFCANCVINERRHCLHKFLQGYLLPDPTGSLPPEVHLAGRDRDKVTAARLGSATGCPVGRLNHLTAPRITWKLTSPYVSGKERQAAICEAKEHIRAITTKAEDTL